MKVTIYIISGSKTDALETVRKKVGHIGLDGVSIMERKELLSRGIINLLRQAWSHQGDWAFFYCNDLGVQSRLFFVFLLALLARGKTKLIVDSKSFEITPTLTRLILVEFPRLLVGGAYTAIMSLSVACVLPPLVVFLQIRKLSRRKYLPGKENRVAYLRTDFWFDLIAGGSVTHTLGVCQGFVDCGFEVFFLSTDELPHANLKQKRVCVVRPRINRYSCMEVNQMFYNYTFCRETLKVLRVNKPTFLYQRCSSLNCSGVILSLLLRVPLILEFNSSVFWSKLSGSKTRYKMAKLLFETINLLGSSRIIVVSNVLKERLIKFGIEEEKILVNANGVDPEVFNPNVKRNERFKNRNCEIYVGFVGIFEYWHGVITLARAAKHVVAKNGDIRFLMIGDGRLRSEMEETVRREGVESQFIFTGVIPHEVIPSYLSACDILVSPHRNMFDGSTFFGSPTKLFEYMAMGKGIIASGVGQISEILKDKENALLVPPGDEEKLAEAILKLAKDKDLREELGKRARADVMKDYTWRRNAEKGIKLYHELTE